MKRDELIQICKFFRDGGEAESDAAYKKGGDFVVCWVAEESWVRCGGSARSRSMSQYVTGVSVDASGIPDALRLHLADSLVHFDHNLFYEASDAEFVSALGRLFSFYLNYKART